MQSKRRWLPRWQRVELVELCLEHGMTRRQAAEWRRVSASTVQFWIDRRRAATPDEVASGGWADSRALIAIAAIVACGELDVALKVGRSAALADALPKGTYRILPGRAHLPSLKARTRSPR